eukprot:5841268-Amphidinium_carterae.1
MISPGERPHTFTRVLLNTCQNEFESLPTTLEPTDEDTQKYAPDELFLELLRASSEKEPIAVPPTVQYQQ